MKHLTFLLSASTLALLTLHSPAAVLFSDSFDRTSGSTGPNGASWGDNDNALGGTVTQTYSMDTSRGGGAQNTVEGNVAVFRNGATQINTDFSTLAPLGYTVAFDFTRRPVNGFITLGIGLDPSIIPATGGFNGNSFLFDTDTTTDGAILLQQDNVTAGAGRIQLFNAGAAVATTDNAFPNNDQTHSALVTVDAPAGYGSGALGTISVSIDGGTATSSSITFDGENSGYLAFFTNQTGPTIDNLVISSIPEPGGIVLTSLGGVALLLRRRR